MALFYTLWVRYGYNHFFNEAWWNGSTKDPKAPPEAPWWENFQDDGIIISVEEDPLDCEIKLFLMTVVSKLMGQEVSTKQEWKVTKEVLFCGLIWTVYGMDIRYKVLWIGKIAKHKGIGETKVLRNFSFIEIPVSELKWAN